MATMEQLGSAQAAQEGQVPSAAVAPLAMAPAAIAPIALRTITAETAIAGQDIQLTHRAPRDAKLITDPVPLIIAHGWNAPASAYGPLAEEIAMMGKPTVTYEEDGGLAGDLNPLNLFRVAVLSSKAAWAATRYVREEFGYEEADGYGHSRGGKTVVDMALNHSDFMRGLVLDCSVGLNNHRLPGMVGRTGQFAAFELAPSLFKLAQSHGVKTGLHMFNYVRRHPGRALAEGVDAGSANLHESVERLLYRGIWVAALQSRNDAYFAADAVERDSGPLLGEHLFTRDDPASNHLAPQLDPAGTAALVMHAVSIRADSERFGEPARTA